MSLPLSCLLVTSVNCAKAAEPTQVSFGGGADFCGPRNRVLDGVFGFPCLPHRMGQFGVVRRGQASRLTCGRYFQPYSLDGSSDAAFRCMYCSNLL